MERQRAIRGDLTTNQPAVVEGRQDSVSTSSRVFVQPVNFDAQGNPLDKILYDAVQKFAEVEFCRQIDFKGVGKAWAVVKMTEVGDGYEVIGISRLAQPVDCHIFHVREGLDDAEREEARNVRDLLTGRMVSYIQDFYGVGTEVFVHVAPAQERWWKSYLRLLRARPANRWIVKV